MKILIYTLFAVIALSSCAHLDQQGQQVQIVETVKEDCESRGLVSEEGFNAEQAEIKLRNSAGLKGGNRIVIKSLKAHDGKHVASGTTYFCDKQ